MAGLAKTIGHARGSPIEAVGHTDLLVRNVRGERQRIMQADQILFLRPARSIPGGKAIEVGMDALPDVVPEVDNTTDVRRGKLKLYESWGFPDPGAPVSPSASDSVAPQRVTHRNRGRIAKHDQVARDDEGEDRRGVYRVGRVLADDVALQRYDRDQQ